jgi:hypothetical protein
VTRTELHEIDWIAVLNDDETYTGLVGCWIATTTPSIVEELNEGADPNQLELVRFNLDHLVQWAIDKGYFDDDSALGRFNARSKPDLGHRITHKFWRKHD